MFFLLETFYFLLFYLFVVELNAVGRSVTASSQNPSFTALPSTLIDGVVFHYLNKNLCFSTEEISGSWIKIHYDKKVVYIYFFLKG